MGATVSLFGYHCDTESFGKVEEIQNLVLKEMRDMGWWNFNTIQLGKNITKSAHDHHIAKIKRVALTCITITTKYTEIQQDSKVQSIVLACRSPYWTTQFYLVIYW